MISGIDFNRQIRCTLASYLLKRSKFTVIVKTNVNHVLNTALIQHIESATVTDSQKIRSKTPQIMSVRRVHSTLRPYIFRKCKGSVICATIILVDKTLQELKIYDTKFPSNLCKP